MKEIFLIFFIVFGTFFSGHSQQNNHLQSAEVYKWLPSNIQERRYPILSCFELKNFVIAQVNNGNSNGFVDTVFSDSMLLKIDSAYNQNKIVQSIVLGKKRKFKERKRYAVDIRLVFVLNYPDKSIEIGFSFPGIMIVNGRKYKIDRKLYDFSLRHCTIHDKS